MQKVTESYLSKVTRYFYFVTLQHCHRASPSRIERRLILLCDRVVVDGGRIDEQTQTPSCNDE